MLKGYEFNQVCRKITKRSIYDREYELLHEFLATDNENICFEYHDTQEAINAVQALKMYAKKARQPLEFRQRANKVFAERAVKECTN